jgi:hypothetical protein
MWCWIFLDILLRKRQEKVIRALASCPLGLRWIEMLAGFPFMNGLIINVHVGFGQETHEAIANPELNR